MQLDEEAIVALAPDASSVKAAKGLVIPGKWPVLGADPQALWGECKGSGATPYQVQVDLAGPAFRCSCPSRKFPCKHGLALMLLKAQHDGAFTASEAPAWVSEWLVSRQQRAQKKVESAEAGEGAATAPDPKAAERKTAQRQQRMSDGIAELSRWLGDRLRQGLASLPTQPEVWEQLAVRMVDAQLPGLAFRLRAAGDLVGEGTDWPAPVLAALGALQLLCDAFARLDALDPSQQADVRAALGLSESRESVLAEGERVQAQWLVLGQSVDEEDRLWRRRVWLRAVESGRVALLLDHAHGARRFEPAFVSGTQVAATLAFFPGTRPLRAVLADTPNTLAPHPLPAGSLDEGLDALADAVAANPWQWPRPLWVSEGVVFHDDGHWRLRVADGRSLPLRLRADAGWQLIAEGGGQPLPLFGEWDGRALRPLCAWREAPVWIEEAELA
jgi:hypothetical protein